MNNNNDIIDLYIETQAKIIIKGEQKMKNVNIVGWLIPDSGKIHQRQEVYSAVKDDLMATLKAMSYKGSQGVN